MEATGWADDGSDETTALSKFSTNCVLSGIGKYSKIEPCKIHVALKENNEARTFKFSKTLTMPRFVLFLTVAPLAFCNVTFLVPEDELAAEDVLLGLHLLKTLRIVIKKMLEEYHENLDGADCSDFQPNVSVGRMGKSGRVMIATLNHLHGDEPRKATSNYDLN